MTMKDELTIRGLRMVPRKGMSRRVRKLAGIRSKMAVRQFAARFDLNMAEAELPIDEYRSVLELFTRRLAPGARPVDEDPKVLVSPVDGAYLIGGDVEQGTLLQAKGRTYSVASLLASEGGDTRMTAGSFMTLYLSPRDYHRIHSPADGEILGYTYVPGDLFPVNQAGVNHVDGLFAVNERVITHLSTEAFGRVDVVKVGATNVGHIRLAYDDAIRSNTGGREIIRRTYPQPLAVKRAAELGVFELGSTVILVTERRLTFDPWSPTQAVKLGQRIADVD